MTRIVVLLSALMVLVAAPAHAEDSATSAPSLPAWLSAITPKVDFRFRNETIDGEGLSLRNRARIRARLGFVAGFSDVDVAFGLASGNDGDPVSANQTLGQGFSKKPIWLDLAYADYHPSQIPGAHLVLGRMKNPFVPPGKTELMWDHDLHPEGINLSWSRAFGGIEPFATGGAFYLEERSKTKDSLLLGAQAGLRLKLLGGKLWFTAGGSYLDYTQTKGSELFFYEDKSGDNSVDATDPDHLVYLYDYNLVEGFAEIGGKIRGFPISVVGDFVRNLDPTDDHTGWLAGVVLGKAKDPRSFEFRYNYRVLQKDAVLGALTDSDFRGGGSDGKGHEASVAFALTKHAKFGATYFFNERGVDDGKTFHRAQVDVAFKL